MKKKIISRSLFLLKQRYEKAKTVPDCIGIHMKSVIWADDVIEFLTEHKNVLNVKLDRNGFAIKRDAYYFIKGK